MWENIKQELLGNVTKFAIDLLLAIVLLIVGAKLIKRLRRFMKTGRAFQKMDKSVHAFVDSFVTAVLYTLLFLSAAMVLGIPTTSVMTLVASAGVAIGLALQGALANFAGGLLILLFKPFRVGDYIVTANGEGTVIDITVVYTTLQTPDHRHITLPNGALTNAAVTNCSAEPLRRIDLTFSASYTCDAEKVKAVLTKVAADDPLVLDDPAPVVRLLSHGDSALVYTLYVWCDRSNYWTVYYNMQEQVKAAFDAAGISIPYPQMDIHIDK